MTIWLLALLLLACSAAAGYRQGRFARASPFSASSSRRCCVCRSATLIAPAFKFVGVVNPILQWVLPPFVVFVVLLTLFKMGGFMAHQKVDVYYKYKAGDLRLALWERLNARLGACVALLNGAAYLVLLCFVIQAVSYWTVQVASGEEDSRAQRLVSQMGRDLQSTGMARVAGAVDSLPVSYYDAADLAGTLYQNPMCEARLLRYPGFLSLGETPEFQTLGQDSGFADMRVKQTPLREVMQCPGRQSDFRQPGFAAKNLGDSAAGHEGFERLPRHRQIREMRRRTSPGALDL